MAINIIFALVLIFLMAGTFFWMWKLSKFLVIPIQLTLFILLVIVVVRVFVNKENADKLKGEITKSNIPEIEKKIVSVSGDALRNAAANKDSGTQPSPQAQPTVSGQTSQSSPAKTGTNNNFVDLL